MTDQTQAAADDQANQQTNGTATAQNSSDNASASSQQGGSSATAGSDNGGTLAQGSDKGAGSDAGTDGGDTSATSSDAAGDLQRLREQLSGGDDKLLKQLERYKSIDAVGKAFREARQVASQGKQPLRLGDKPTDDDIKAYREAVGIPEDPAQYPGDFRDDFKPSDADKAILGEFKQAMHASNVDPQAAKAALEWYQDFATAQQQELDGNMAKVAKETQASLRAEWGGEYDGNLNAAQELMTTHLGADGFNRMMGMRLQDGSRLQDDPAFVKMMAQLGADYYGGNAIFNGDIETTSKTVQERIDGLLQLRQSDPEQYKSDKVQAEITKLYAQRDKINART